jgi:hypothetical protein
MASRRRRPSLLSPTAYLRRGALYKGVFGGSRGWLAVGAVVWGPRLVRKAMGRNEEVVTTEVLRPGDVVCLRTIPQDTREQRRAVSRTHR